MEQLGFTMLRQARATGRSDSKRINAQATKQSGLGRSIVVIWLIGSLLVNLALNGLAQAKDLPGSSPTSWGVSQGGAFQFQIPIAIPAGRNGVQPNLSLSYSSGSGNGSLGMGWDVSGLDSITRCGQTFATHGQRVGVQHSDSDRLCYSGQPLILVRGSYGVAGSEYRTELDKVAKITAHGNHTGNINGGTMPSFFIVWRKDLSRRYYGFNAATHSRATLPGTDSAYAWKLSRVMDRNTNYYEVTYNATDHLPQRIDYTLRNGLSAQQKVDFVYETRPDVRHHYVVGQKLTRSRRLQKLIVRNAGSVVREYSLSYDSASVTARSRLTEVQECGMNGTCFAPIDIRWAGENEGEDNGFADSTSVLDMAPHAMFRNDLLKQFFAQGEETFDGTLCVNVNGCWVNSKREMHYGAWADLNGDGELDQVISVVLPSGSTVERVYIKDKAGNQWRDQTSTWKLPQPLRNYDDALVNHPNGRFAANVAHQGQLVDVNGDGLVDVVYAYRYFTDAAQNAALNTVKKTYLNTGSGWQESSAYEPKDTIYDYVINGEAPNRMETVRARLIDINGDGLVDWVRAYHHYLSAGNGTNHIATWLNNGNGWDNNTSPAYALPDVFAEYRSGNPPLTHGELVDVNGDGLLDWVQAYQKSGESLTSNTWLNSENGFGVNPNPSPLYRLAEAIYDNLSGWDDKQPVKRGSFVDVNGDGLRDFVRSFRRNSTETSQAVRINSGRGWTTNSHFNPPFVHLDFTYTDRSRGWPLNTRGFYIDLNRDGYIDYTQAYKDHTGASHYQTWLNSAGGWGTVELNTSPYHPRGLFFDYSGRDKGVVRHARFLDINNDGSVDVVNAGHGGISTRLNRLLQTDKVAQITTTMGVEVQPEFSALTDNQQIYQRFAGAAQAAARHLEAPIYVVSELRTSRADQAGGWNTTNYQYSGAQVHRLGRGFLGFKTRTTIDDKGISTYQKYRQDYPYIGRLQEQRKELNGVVISKLDHAYQNKLVTHGNGAQTRIPYVRATTTEQFEAGQLYRSSYRRTTLDDYANVTETLTRVGLDNLSHNHYQRQSTETNVYYPADEAAWQVGLLSDSTHLAQAPTVPALTRHSHFKYDTRGRLTDQQQEPNDNTVRFDTLYSYDVYGNIQAETNTGYHPSQSSRINTIAYDTDYRLPASLTNALQQTAILSYHQQCDKPSSVTDINGIVTRYTYDDFCRQTHETIEATATTAAITRSVAYQTVGLSCGDCQSAPILKTTISNSGQSPIATYSNRHGQALVSVTYDMHNSEIRQHTDYDRFGRVSRESQPLFSGDTAYWNTRHYDEFDRLSYITLPFLNEQNNAASIRQNYQVNNTGELEQINTNTLGRTKTAVANALGQIVEIRNANNQAMHYAFDAHGNLTQTLDALGNEINVIYDLLGRRTQLDDPDLGISHYTYNSFGELTSQRDARNQTIDMAYDKLSRLIERRVPGTAAQSGGITTFSYDSGANSVGQLISISRDDGYQKTFSYDALGRPSGDTTTIDGENYSQSYTYNQFGQLASHRYPDSGANSNGQAIAFGVSYTYQNGYLSAINGLDPGMHWRADHYDATGRLTQDTLGGALITTHRQFNPAQGVLEQIQSVRTATGDQVQNLTYQYDPNNNLRIRSDALQNSIETFSYDTLDRLTAYTRNDPSLTNPLSTSVGYDAIGNITRKSDVGNYLYHPGKPHALQRVTGTPGDFTPFAVNWEWDGQTILKQQPSIHNQTFVYDANGNIQVSGNREFDWTAFDKPVQIRNIQADNSQRASTFRYDAEFERISKTEAEYNQLGHWVKDSEKTVYIGTQYQRITDETSAVTHRYTINTGGGTIQIDRADNSDQDITKYLLTDALGSTNVVLDGQGNEEQRLAFDPWGMRTKIGDITAANALTNRGYTGHEMDDELGLINMNARIYDPYLGKFLSADPVLPDPYDIQAFNRYSYVLGNPLKYTDPTGNAAAEGFAVGVSFVGFLFGWGGGDRRPYEYNLGVILEAQYGGIDPNEDYSNEDSGFDDSAIGVILEESSPANSDPGSNSRYDDRTAQQRRIDDTIADGQASCNIGGCSGTEAGVPVLYADSTGSLFPGPGGGAFVPWFELFGHREFEKAAKVTAEETPEAAFEVALAVTTVTPVGASVRTVRVLSAEKGQRIFKNLAPGEEIGQAIVFPVSHIKTGFSGRRNFVVLESGELIIGKTGHLSLSQGANVLSAGEARFVDGALRSLNNASGHFKPFGANAKNAAESAFEKAGFDSIGKFIEKTF